VTLILSAAAAGDPVAASELLPLVYAALRRLASARLARLPSGQTLQPTELVHEAFVELVGRGDPGWKGRAHFFGAAAQAMHDILVDRARARARHKRGGGARALPLEEADCVMAITPPTEDLLALATALDALRREHPRRHEVAMLRYFVGLSEEEIAELFKVTTRTVEREWRFARAWLTKRLGVFKPAAPPAGHAATASPRSNSGDDSDA